MEDVVIRNIQQLILYNIQGQLYCYDRFGDLFNQVPIPNRQNFTISIDNNNINSRLVYASNSIAKTTSISSHQKCKSSRNYLQENKINKKINKYNQNINKQDQSKYQTQTTIKKIKNNKNYSLIKIKNYQSKNNPIVSLKQKIQSTYRKNNNYQKIFHNQNGPYYITTKIIPKNTYNQTTKITIQKDHSQNRSSINRSYVYGDTNRKLLTSKKVQEFGINDINSSREQSSTQFDHRNQKSRSKISVNPQENQVKYESKFQQKSKVDAYVSIEQATISQQFQINYVDRMQQLKRILKNNKRKQQKISGIEKNRTKQSSKIGITLKQKQTKKNYQNILHVQGQQKTQSIKQQEKQRKQIKIDHRHEIGQDKKCKFYDNRCLGLSFFEEGEINFMSVEKQML